MSDTSPDDGEPRRERRQLRPHEWHKLRNPLRIAFNFVICELCKYLPPGAKNWLYRRLGVDVGRGTIIAPHVQIDPFFPERISIGEGTVIGWGTKLLTHEYHTTECLVGDVHVGDETLVGHGSSTRPGVAIGDDATVAAHSFVNRDVADGETVGGTPIETLD
jgi:acetyltransferase-like isoleucine patch superfamily enzyme